MSVNRNQQSTGFTLSDATDFGRKALVGLGIGVVTYLVLRMLFITVANYYKAMNPPPPPPPTVGFGRLPSLVFPEKEEVVWPEKMSLETARNRLPQFGDRAKVFAMEVPTPNLLGDSKARNIAARYGFTSQPEILDANNYRWIKYQPIEYIFEINLINYNFTLRSDYNTRPELITSESLPEKHNAVQTVKSYLRKNEFLPQDIATASGEVSYMRVLAGELFPAVSLSDSDFIQVDINRVPIEGELKMFTPQSNSGIVSAVITGGLQGDDGILQMHYYHQKIIYEDFHTYPLKPIEQAWNELRNGKGYIASGEDVKEAVIREVELGYFDSFIDQPYLQPIYVFSGDDDFVAYVHAIDSSYVIE
ncbi:MAG: hypothetical protein XD95_0478 [Microgenomates bacterium 39_7]|nr:MAG: hypothetical protein XD95_0478 [Microgenomates bacterium 39_7]